MRTVLILTLLFSSSAYAAERWECADKYESNWSPILVVLTIDDDMSSGTVTVAGTTHLARYKVDGFDRRWDFGLSEGSYYFALIISPNGEASYFNFSGSDTTKPSQFFKCRVTRR